MKRDTFEEKAKLDAFGASLFIKTKYIKEINCLFLWSNQIRFA